VSLSHFFRQEPWVLESASADHPVSPAAPEIPTTRPEEAEARRLIAEGVHLLEAGRPSEAEALWRRALTIAPGDLLVRRAMNQLCPSLNRHPLPRRRSRPPWGTRFALLLPGQLRCLDHSRRFLERLCRRADLFVCTEGRYREAAASLRCRCHGEVRILEDDPVTAAEDAALPVASMKQWHKLGVCLQMVRRREERTGRRYTHIVKLRSDYLHVSPERFFEDLLLAPGDGLATASDKVFGGPRDLMFLFEGFYRAIPGHFDGGEDRYWPINAMTILRSDDSCKWYGMNWPVALVGEPVSVPDLRGRLEAGGAPLARALAAFRPRPDERYVRLSQGHARFASEVCFARFLLFCGIAWRQNQALRGFLRGDREKA
jgi:hypothetical protein